MSTCFTRIFLLAVLFPAFVRAQAPVTEQQNLSRMQLALKEARELQSQPAVVLEKLKPLVDELGLMYQNKTLSAEASKVFQETLLLKARAQARRLAPEPEIVSSLKQILLLNPRVTPAQFNPREQALIERVRTTESGRLLLRTDPTACSVSCLDVDLGTTPLEMPLVAGTYRLHLRKQGYRDQEIEAVIKADETTLMEATLRRSVVEIPLSINIPNVSVVVNSEPVGVSIEYKAWLASLPSELQEFYAATFRQWGVDTESGSFFRLREVPPGDFITLELRAPCFKPFSLRFSVPEQEVDWSRPIVIRPELKRVELKRDFGLLEITSNPPGADVLLDGRPQGKAPLKLETCVGAHRVQLLHAAGQYVENVKVEYGRTSKVTGELKPALTFLGVYSVNPENQSLMALDPDWERIERKLSLDLRAFSDTKLSSAELRSLNKKNKMPPESLLAVGASATGDLGYLIKQTAAEAGRADLLLIGLKTGDKYAFRLYSTLYPVADLIELPDLSEGALGFLTTQLNKAEMVRSRLRAPDLGMDLLDVPDGLSILRIRPFSEAAKSRLAAGMIIRSVDQKPLDYRALQILLAGKKPGQTVSLEVRSPQGLFTADLPVSYLGAEYPWSTPDGFPNSVLAALRQVAELDPTEDDARYANLSIALGFMRQREWKLALDFLDRANLEPQKPGVSLGTVLYYQGRCYEALEQYAQAESAYGRAKDYTEATLGFSAGLPVALFAERRIQFLKKKTR